jgi:hypothetical protein
MSQRSDAEFESIIRDTGAAGPSADLRRAERDLESVTANDTASDVESKLLGLDEWTGDPSELAADARRAFTEPEAGNHRKNRK